MPKNHPNKENPDFLLTQREKEILEQLVTGAGNNSIAGALGITTNTVEKHLTTIYKKINVKCRAEAILWWIQNGGVFRS